MIRQATKYDKQQILELIKQFRDESKIEQYEHLDDVDYFYQLLDVIIAGKGIIYIEDNKGLIMGLISQIIWCKKTLYMHELAWYVKPEYRNGTTGYKLLKAYIDYGNKLKQENRIKFFTLGKLPATPNFDYTKLGFKKTDEIWIK